MRSVLVCTHHLFQWGGSELVALELIEALRARGLSVTAFVPFADAGFCEGILPEGVSLLSEPAEVRIGDYDMVYAQHQTQVPVYAAQDWSAPGPLPVLICAHLSPWEPMEFPGPFLEPECADIVLANSAETRSRLERFDLLPQQVTLWPNPAPASFDSDPSPRGRRKLRRLLSVTHHLPEELAGAFDLLEAEGVRVTRLGQAAVSRRVQPSDLAGHDAVVTIGKTVQYALRHRRPVFCYDHFGGPGWLDDGGFDAAAAANFSGRCTRGPRPAADLADRLRGGFGKAWNFAQRMDAERIAPYALDRQLDALLDRAAAVDTTGADRARDRAPARFPARLDHEAALYALVDRHYRAARRGKKTGASMAEAIDRLRRTNTGLEERRRVLRDRNALLQGQIDSLKERLKLRGTS